MKKEEIYNEAIGGDEGFAPGEGYPSCDGQPCANVSGDDGVATDTMTDATPTGDEGPSDGAASGETGEESGVEAGGSEQLAPELERRIAEWQDKYLRLQAEFDNYRKRTLREKMELVERGGRVYPSSRFFRRRKLMSRNHHVEACSLFATALSSIRGEITSCLGFSGVHRFSMFE